MRLKGIIFYDVLGTLYGAFALYCTWVLVRSLKDRALLVVAGSLRLRSWYLINTYIIIMEIIHVIGSEIYFDFIDFPS
jgi:hypothetical protein